MKRTVLLLILVALPFVLFSGTRIGGVEVEDSPADDRLKKAILGQ